MELKEELIFYARNFEFLVTTPISFSDQFH